SVKGVVVCGGRGVLLRTPQGEWKQPGGRIERDGQPIDTLRREVEQSGVAPDIGPLQDVGWFEAVPGR
ncbi:MAG: NUDIX domain-containing protein, partial [Egibacteraceae bacterium]